MSEPMRILTAKEIRIESSESDEFVRVEYLTSVKDELNAEVEELKDEVRFWKLKYESLVGGA